MVKASKVQKDGQHHKTSQKQETQSQLKRLTSKRQELQQHAAHIVQNESTDTNFFSTHLATMEEVPESWCGVHLDQRKQMDKYKVLSGVEGRETFAEVYAMFGYGLVWTSGKITSAYFVSLLDTSLVGGFEYDSHPQNGMIIPIDFHVLSNGLNQSHNFRNWINDFSSKLHHFPSFSHGYSRRFATATARTASFVTANDVGHWDQKHPKVLIVGKKHAKNLIAMYSGPTQFKK